MTSVNLKPVTPAHVHSAHDRPSSSSHAVLLALLLALAVIAVYYPVHSQPFANYDDPDYVSDNVHVRSGLNWTTLQWAMTARDAANWHPVTWISHALDVQLFGVTPSGPHDVNVLLHIVNALLLFWVLQRATGYVGRSWMVAALFALHPLNVESVAWIAERKNLLSVFFFLLALDAYRRYAEKQKLARYIIVAVLFALALMSKPVAITFPFVLLLWDYWPLGRLAVRSSPFALLQNAGKSSTGEKRMANREWRPSLSAWVELFWEKVPLLGLCGLSAVLTLNAQSAGGATSGYAFTMRLENAVISYARYLGDLFWPTRLALFYPYPLKPYSAIAVLGATVLLLGISAAVAIARRRRYLPVGWLWFLGTMVPMIGVIQVGTQAMADRYAYLPFIGLFIMLVWLVADYAAQKALPITALRGAAVVVLVALAFLSHRQVSFWNDHVTLWTHALEVTHDNWVAENNLGTALLKLSRAEDAIPHFRRAAALFPEDPNSNLNIGTYEQMHGNLAAAIERYKFAANVSRNVRTKARAYNNLGYAYKDIGDLSSARESFQQAVKVDPLFAGAWISLGLVAQRLGDLPLATTAYSRATQINPSDFGYLLLAGSLDQSGDQSHAQLARDNAKRLSKNYGAAERYANELLNH